LASKADGNRTVSARDDTVLAAIEEALSCLLGKGERLSSMHFSAYGDPEWEATDLPPLQTGMHVHMKLMNGHLCSPLIDAWSESVKQAAIALTLARDTLKGGTDGQH